MLHFICNFQLHNNLVTLIRSHLFLLRVLLWVQCDGSASVEVNVAPGAVAPMPDASLLHLAVDGSHFVPDGLAEAHVRDAGRVIAHHVHVRVDHDRVRITEAWR